MNLLTVLSLKRVVFGTFGVLMLGWLSMQVVPISKTNPPVIQEPLWDSPITRELTVVACYDCHSNESSWPWYADVAPMKLLVRRNVLEGRRKLNFSEWTGKGEVDELIEVIREDEMPPWDYLLMHPEAKLSEQDKQLLIQGYRATFNITGEASGEGSGTEYGGAEGGSD